MPDVIHIPRKWQLPIKTIRSVLFACNRIWFETLGSDDRVRQRTDELTDDQIAQLKTDLAAAGVPTIQLG